MKPTMISFLSLLFLELLAVATITVSFSNGSTYVGCIQSEREALLRFKQDLNDSSNRLSSWVGDHGDCCRWDAVVCSNFTGHVLELHLGNPFSKRYYLFETEYEAYERSMLRGKISSSLLDLKHLVYLDLSFNDFEGVQIPKFLGSMSYLRYLNLSSSHFVGMIPHQLGNLSILQYLDLSNNYDFSHNYYDMLYAQSLSWVSGLSSLKLLDLSLVNLTVASDWLLEINKLSSLTVLRLFYCELQHIPPLPFANFTSSLTTLGLSGNQFDNTSADWLLEIYKLSSLKVLLLSHCGLQHIPPLPFSNFTSSLTTLDLSRNQFDNTSVDWLLEIYKLSSLKVLQLSDCGLHHIPLLPFPNFTSSLTSLDLSGNQFDNTSADWLLEIYKLSSLKVLQLSDCGLHHIPLSPFPNFTSSLTTLDLSWNRLDNTSIPSWVFNLCNLEFLGLRGNHFKGPIPDGLQNLTSLQHLDLSDNYFNSSIPNWLSRIRSLESLDLSYNSNLQGPIPISLGRLCNLKSLSLSSIKLNQDIYDIFHIFSECIIDGLKELRMWGCQLFGQLTNDQLGLAKNLEVLKIGSNSISGYVPSSLGELSFLQELDLSYNKLNGTLAEIHFANLSRLIDFDASGNSLKVNHDWVPPFQLQYLHLSSCHLGPQFPSWLRSLQRLFVLDLSSSGIVDSIPSWFWRSISHLGQLNLSHNQIQGEIPNLNNLRSNLFYLNLRSNNFSGPLPLIPRTLSNVHLSDNAFSGSIFHFLCHKINKPRRTGILKLGNNLLSGELPDCWMNWQDLIVLDLSDNTFTGNIPFSIGNLNDLASLHLQNNSLSGEIPTSLGNCTALETLDIGENEFFGSVPTWLGQRFSELVILNLRSNKFHGFLPTEFCRLTSLQILDLAYNDLSGSIPSCIRNFSAMVKVNYSKGNSIQLPFYWNENPMEDATVVMKGTTAQYDSILNLVRSVDLSKNNFSGEIPTELTSLHALQSLNLSHNSLTGRIPQTIGDMRDIESIDLSANRLYGEIPQSITGLTFLNHLNLSNNKLTGRIPSSTQLQSFNASSFTRNELCGSPMKNCTVATVPTPRHENGEQEVDWFYVSMGLGFVVGFWSLIGPLLINRRWRYTYCRFLDRLGDKFYFGVRKLF